MRSFKRFGSVKDWLLLAVACAALLFVITHSEWYSPAPAGSVQSVITGSSLGQERNFRSAPAGAVGSKGGSIFDFSLKDIEGNIVKLDDYRTSGMKAMLVVNVASH
jgi:hypothetical protein